MKVMYKILAAAMLLVGTGALFGGAMAIFDPYGGLFGMPVEVLRKGPFTSFLIPGLLLFFVIGMGHLISFIALKRRWKFYIYMSGGAGGALLTWILVQCYMLQGVYFLHILFFLIGMLEGIISLYLLFKLKQFPFSNGI